MYECLFLCLFFFCSDPEKARREAIKAEKKRASMQKQQKSGEEQKKKKRIKKIPQDEIDMMNDPEAWGNNMMTTAAWEAIHANDIVSFRDMLMENPEVAHVRSEDGRGPMWWAHEYNRPEFIKLLVRLGVPETLKDAKGVRPIDLSK
mmetsp:Transcript_21735/g.50167  ORF Transcript_21735/g.50167 Transcript_21735/m.50167 type:complete len:147 (+) Transcript_21735:1150-1590(+)